MLASMVWECSSCWIQRTSQPSCWTPWCAVLPSDEPGAISDAQQVPGEHGQMAYDLVNRVGGPLAGQQLTQFILNGYRDQMGVYASSLYEPQSGTDVQPQAAVRTKRARNEVASVASRKAVWKRCSSS
jgi:hypothetical protein